MVFIWHLITRIGPKKDTRTAENTTTSGRGGNRVEIQNREKKKIKYLEKGRGEKKYFLLIWARNDNLDEAGSNIVRKAVAAR